MIRPRVRKIWEVGSGCGGDVVGRVVDVDIMVVMVVLVVIVSNVVVGGLTVIILIVLVVLFANVEIMRMVSMVVVEMMLTLAIWLLVTRSEVDWCMLERSVSLHMALYGGWKEASIRLGGWLALKIARTVQGVFKTAD